MASPAPAPAPGDDLAAHPGGAAGATPVAPAGARAGVQRTADVLARFLARATVRGERAVAVARLVLALLAFGQYLAFHVGLLFAGHPKALTFSAGLVLAAGYSIFTLRKLRTRDRLLPYLVASVAVDAATVGIVLAGILLWPRADYAGIVRVPDIAMLVLAIVAAGIRLSRPVAAAGAVLLSAVGALAVAADLRLNAGHVSYTAEDLTTLAVLLLGAALFAWAIAARTRKLVYEGADAALRAERVRQRLGIYVSEEVARAALAAPEMRIGGRRQDAAVLFSDLRGFSSYAETLSPERLVGELNAYLDAMVRAVRSGGGVVDKFIGDAIMVVFGIPEPERDDAARALRTAATMQEALAEHNAERARAGRPALAHGIGVHYGPVVAGNIGNVERLQFTVIGDVVNLASRLEAATKTMGVPALLSADVVAAARNAPTGKDLPALRALGRTAVRGREGEIDVYTFADAPPA
jgi:adenylate cyclase